MPLKLAETRVDHKGRALPAGIYSLAKGDGAIVSYKVRWREESDNGVRRNAAKSFSVRRLGSADRALEAARGYRKDALQIASAGDTVLRPDAAAGQTIEELFREWCATRGPSLSKRYAEDAVRRWDREIGSRSIARVRLDRLSRDPSILTRFQDELEAEGISAANRTQVLKLLRAVLRWGRRRHPNALTTELSGLFELPSQTPKRLAYAADAYGLERIIEAVLRRPARNTLLPLRDAALVAAMGFTVAARPSEWLYSVTWSDIHDRSVELQRPAANLGGSDLGIGLKTGAQGGLAAAERARSHRRLSDGPRGTSRTAAGSRAGVPGAWREGSALVAHQRQRRARARPWSQDEYKRWTARVWRPAREVAAESKGTPAGLASMRFYDCRHTAISMALHSTLVMVRHGMNLHNLAGWAGHDVQTLQRHYAHIIARYQGGAPIDLERECDRARGRVEAEPFSSERDRTGPQRPAQRRRRARARASRVSRVPH